jgi:hypothetical protein
MRDQGDQGRRDSKNKRRKERRNVFQNKTESENHVTRT